MTTYFRTTAERWSPERGCVGSVWLMCLIVCLRDWVVATIILAPIGLLSSVVGYREVVLPGVLLLILVTHCFSVIPK